MKKGTQTLALFATLSLGVSSTSLTADEAAGWFDFVDNLPFTIEPTLPLGLISIKLTKDDKRTLKDALLTTVAGYAAYRACHLAYLAYMDTTNTDSLDTRLTHLEAAANGMLAKRYAGMECTRSEEFKQQLWALSDQLLDLRCQVLNPDCQKYHDELQKGMLDKIDTLLKRLDALQKFKVA